MQSKVSVGIVRKLRRDQTPWEAKLWRHLRNRNFYNVKFKRQLRLGGYVFDFGSNEIRVVIELDGSGHANSETKITDLNKQNYAISQGYTVIRFWNNELDTNMESVLEQIKKEI